MAFKCLPFNSLIYKVQNRKSNLFCLINVFGLFPVLVWLLTVTDNAQSLETIPSGQQQLLQRLPENPSPKRDRTRYRHKYPINPLIRTADNNQSFSPMLWDFAPGSYPVDFYLFTKDNPYSPEMLSVSNATDSKYFDKSHPTKVIIHDFMQSTENKLIYELKDAYMNKKEDYNVIMVDWEPARSYTYTVAVTVSEYVGKMASRLIMSMKVGPGTVHAIGFGLGAHSAGVLGNELKIHRNVSLARITGLDPSLPLFRMAGNYFKLDPEDAAFVDVIHTDGGDNLWNSNHLGMGKECGHVDIYPNRGIFQPGCHNGPSTLPNYESLQCSHTRALHIYKESVQDEMSFVGCKCPTWEDFMNSNCNCKHEANRIFVGEACPKFARRGNYFLMTQEAPPYGMGGKGVIPSLTRSPNPGAVMQNLFSANGSIIRSIGQIASIFTSPIKPFLTLVRNTNENQNNDGDGAPVINNEDMFKNDGGGQGFIRNPFPPRLPHAFQQDIMNDHTGMAMNYHPMMYQHPQPPLPYY